ncbi:nucleic acid-binding [Micractinium conductrix]|uniref:Nucleic acid-binding n=1 Tax=Micractinium conductrix TaxID=554055 RepID=A0A2P6V315_9CHLO|nr:nucleic acid-binding [Micractinium conductrix]|eukprot:PSC68489.1 nucleic acid-binding [Micractinium conductrix]
MARPLVAAAAWSRPQAAWMLAVTAPGRAQVQARAYAFDAAAAEAGGNAEIDEVDFDPALANMVKLIGTVGGKKDLKVFERSKLLPFAIGIKPNAKQRPEEIEWINVEAWGPLAERADEQLNKGDRVAIEGRLKVDKWEDRMTGQKRTAFKITANSIAKVRSKFGAGGGGGFDQAGEEEAPWDRAAAQEDEWAGSAQRAAPRAGDGAGAGLHTVEELWMDYFEHPDQWWDNRVSKRSPNAPDFKRKEGGRDAPALWLSGRNTPGWVDGELKRLDSAKDLMG